MDDIFKNVDVETKDEDVNPLEALVGEGKKYSSVEALAKAKMESDSFIAQLQKETAELRQEVASKQTIDEILTQIKQSQAQPESRQPTPSIPAEPAAPDIEQLVASLLEKKEAQKMVSQNERAVEDKLREKFGNDAALHVNKKARELGVTVDYLKKIAKESPSAFFRLTELDRSPAAAPTPPAPRNSMGEPMSAPSSGRDKAYYERLKAQDRTAYFSPKVQLEMYKDMKKVLESGGNW